MGEINPSYIKDVGDFGNIKEKYHETKFQPTYSIDQYIDYICDLNSDRNIFLVNLNVSLVLPISKYKIATKNIDRALRSMADFIIKSTPELSPSQQLSIISNLCRSQIETNYIITKYCERTGDELTLYENLYVSKKNYEYLDMHEKKSSIYNFIRYLKNIYKT